MLAKKPLFAIVAVITLALGIGANTAIFSVVNAVLLRALPYHNPERLIILSTVGSSGDRDGFSIPEAQDFRTQMHSLEDLAAFQSQSVNVTGGERPDRVRGAFVSANYFKFFNLNPLVRQALWRVDADQPMWKIRTVEFLVNRSVADRKFLLALMGIFASLALVLTMIGLYGVISYLVNQRTQEIGIRMALGAQMRDILQMVLKQGMILVLTGVALGLAAAWLSTRLMARLLYQVSATDPLTFAVIAAFLIAVALLACYLPARRATKVDPLVALRYE